ncbi:MAG: hypothetical protein NT075_14325 [Chloroflexi bacterium]|nr:hypothetical protein [Chloroflexota bacterium]
MQTKIQLFALPKPHRLCIRNSKWLLLLVALLISPLSAQIALAAPTDTTVTNCDNDTQLNHAVTSAGTTTITFDCGPGPHTIPIGGYMTVAGEVIIDGGGQITLDGGGASAFFQVFVNHTLDLRNITLQNGIFKDVNPLENFGTMTLTNVQMKNNQTTNQGGAVTNTGTLVVRNSSFTGNTANDAGGAIASASGGSVVVESSSFTSNRVPGSFGTGGAIAVQSNKATITNSTFRNNSALDGGALYVNTSTVVTVTGSTFTENNAGYGGAIESRGELQVDYSNFQQNQANGGDGGAIWVLDSDTDITYSTFNNNKANTTGGGISCYGNTLSVIHSTISGNQSSDNGGGIYSTCNLNVSNTTLSGNKAPGKGGGGIYQASSGSANIAATTIAGNTAAFGAGVYNDGAGSSTLSLQFTLLANNTTGNCDGVITSLGFNLASDNNCGALTQPGDQKNVNLPLGPLTNNGGPTQTLLPLDGNPAIDAIPTPCSFSHDQRGIQRPQHGKCDIGAVEVEAVKSIYLPVVIK